MRGQLSAEMLIMIVVILAVVAIAATQLMGEAKDTSVNIQNQTQKINQMTADAIKSKEGGYCFDTSDCREEDGETLECIDNHCLRRSGWG